MQKIQEYHQCGETRQLIEKTNSYLNVLVTDQATGVNTEQLLICEDVSYYTLPNVC